MLPIVAIAVFAMAVAAGERGGAAPVIAVVSPAQPDRAMIEALNRFRGEAAAVGFGVIIVPASPGAPSAQMESVARAVPGVATVAFVRGNEPTELDVWFTDRLDGQTVVDHVSVESNRADRAVVLAVKGVDVLRARMFGLLARRGRSAAGTRSESALTALPTPPTTPPPAAVAVAEAVRSSAGAESAPTSREGAAATSPAARVPPQAAVGSGVTLATTPQEGGSAAPRMKLATGVGAMRSIPDLGTAFLVVLRGQYDFTATSALRFTVGGLGSRLSVTSPAGRALVQDTVVMLEWAISPWAHRRLRPVLAAGGGLHYFSAEGMAADPFQARTDHRMVGMFGVTVGVRAALGSRLALGLDAGAQVLLPQVQVSVAGGNPQRGGRPATMATLLLEARL